MRGRATRTMRRRGGGAAGRADESLVLRLGSATRRRFGRYQGQGNKSSVLDFESGREWGPQLSLRAEPRPASANFSVTFRVSSVTVPAPAVNPSHQRARRRPSRKRPPRPTSGTSPASASASQQVNPSSSSGRPSRPRRGLGRKTHSNGEWSCPPVIKMRLPGGTGCSTPRRPSFTAPIQAGQHATWRERNCTAAVAPEDRLTELPARLACPAGRSQQIRPPGPGVLGHVHRKASRVRAHCRLLLVLGQRPHRRHCGKRRRCGERAPSPWLTLDETAGHRTERTGIWDCAMHRPGHRARRRDGGRGTTPALDILHAAVSIMARAPHVLADVPAAAGGKKTVIGAKCPMRERRGNGNIMSIAPDPGSSTRKIPADAQQGPVFSCTETMLARRHGPRDGENSRGGFSSPLRSAQA